jgi:hypothetical protein
VAIACESRLEWEIFDVLRQVDGIRVTACSGLRHVAELCARGEVEVAVLDLDHLGLDVSIHEGLASLVGRDVSMVLISSALAPAGIDVTRMQWARRPVSAEQLVFTLRSLSRRPYLRRPASR